MSSNTPAQTAERNLDLIQEQIFNTALIDTSDHSDSEDVETVLTAPKKGIKRYTISGEQLLKRQLESTPFLIEGLVHRGSLIGLVGSSETGKSTFARDICYAIASGQSDYLGRELLCKHRSIIYVSSEDSLDMMQEYLLERLKGDQPEKIKGFRLLDDCEDHLKKLEYELAIEPADLVVLDVYADFFVGDINSSISARSFLNNYQKLVEKFKCTFLFIHHTGKRTERLAPSKNNAVGSQGFESKMRLVLELRMDSSDDDKRHICIVKGNYLKPQDKKKSILLRLNPDRSYTFIGQGTELEKLVATGERQHLDQEEVSEILKLSAEGKGCREISNIMKADGVNVGKTKGEGQPNFTFDTSTMV